MAIKAEQGFPHVAGLIETWHRFKTGDSSRLRAAQPARGAVGAATGAYMPGSNYINRAHWKYMDWLAGFNGGPLRGQPHVAHRHSRPAARRCSALDPNITRDAWSMRAVFEPMYRQALLGWDISVPMGVGFTPNGSRNPLGPSAMPPENGGDFTLGISGLYMNTWDLNLAYTTFFGSAGPFLDSTNSYSYKQARADRDFVAFTVRRSF